MRPLGEIIRKALATPRPCVLNSWLLLVICYACASPTAQADCTTKGSTTTCDNSAPNPYRSGIGNGKQDNYTVTVNGGTSAANAAQISVGNRNAIALDNNAIINIGDYASVINNGTSGGGSKNNTILFANDSTVTVGIGATVRNTGTSETGEAINPYGTNNTIINNGLIQADSAYAIYVQNGNTTNTVINNATGVIRSSHGAIGGASGATFIITNRGLIDGDLVLRGNHDQLTVYTGSQITGSLGGNGNDIITLAGTGSQSSPGSIEGFSTLTKVDSGAWTLNGTITGNVSVDIKDGTLNLTGNNTGFTGSIVVEPAGTLVGQAVSSSPGVTNNGQVLFNQSMDATYAGLISGTGGVTKSGAGILAFATNQAYSGGTTISAGELQLGTSGTTGLVAGDIVDNSTLSFDLSNTNTFAGLISGSGTTRQTGAGTIVLTNSNSYTGGTIVDSGTLQLGNGTTSGSISGNVLVDGIGTLSFGRSDVYVFAGAISGSGEVAQMGSGTTVLTGANTYTGNTIIGSGTLQVGNGGTNGSIVGDVIDGGALVFNRNDTFAYNDVISGAGSLTQAGAGTLILTNDNTVTGPTTIAAGALQLGDGIGAAGSVAGSVAGAILDNGTLIFDRGDDFTYPGAIGGSGAVTQVGSHVLTLTGANTYTGLTTVASGTLKLDGSIAGNAQVDPNATLRGTGSIAGTVTVASGGHVAPGNSPGTLNFGSLTLNSGSQLDYELGLPNIVGGGTNDLIQVAGNLTLAGNLNVTDVGGFGTGVYRLFNYGGTLTDNGLAFGSLPTGFTASDLQVQTSQPNQVNLIVSAGGFALQFWDGSHTTGTGSVDGGTGVWDATTTGWTSSSGTVNAPWGNGFAVFEGTAGTVTLGQNINVSGMQFLTNGYAIQGNGFTLAADPSTVIRVDAGVTATVGATIADGAGGAATLTKRDSGVLILSGNNTYTGGTAVDGGTLQIASNTNLGASSGALSFSGGTLATTASFSSSRHITLNADGGVFAPVSGTTLTLPGLIDGTGTLTKADAGTLVLSGSNTYSGGTVLNNGVLAVSTDANLGASSGLLDFTGGTLRFDASFNPAATRAITLQQAGGTIDTNGSTVTLNQIINGDGALTKSGSGTLILAAANVYDGGTTIAAGTLQIGNGGTAGNILGNVLDNGSLVFNRLATLTYPGTISGTGNLMQLGAGTTVLTGNNSYAGGTTITSGMLQIGDGGTTGNISGNVTNNSALVFNRSDNITLGGSVIGTGSLAQNGNGTLFVTNSVTEAGSTTINAGTLSIGNGTTDGTVATNIVDNSALVFNRSSVTYGNVISGPGTVQKLGGGTLILTGSNTYSGITTISAGTVQVGNGGSTGTLGSGAVLDNGMLTFQRSDAVSYSGVISGTGGVTQAGPGTLTLTGRSTYTGATVVTAGTLLVNGTLGPSAVTANSGTTLGGAGIIAGPVTINGGTLAPGAQIGAAGTLYVGGLSLHSQLNVDLAMPDVIGSPNDLINDTGNLSLTGVLNVNDAGQFASTPGSYRLINYEGTLSGAGLTLGSIPGGANEAVIQTVVRNEINLIKFINGLPVQFWDGAVANEENGVIDGGSGTWNTSSPNWTNVNGTINQSWLSGMGIFTGAAGIVTLGQPVTASALQFLTDGYRVEGNGYAITLVAMPGGAAPLIRVDPGVTATINAVLAGNQGLTKADPGTLVLTAANTYTGGTTISNGTLQLGEGGTTGSIAGDVADNGILAFNRSDSSTFAGTVSGTGGLTQMGSGTTVLTGNNSYSGGTTISAGALQIGAGSTSGAIVGNVTDNATLIFDRSDTVTYAGTISGAGQLVQTGSGTTILDGVNTYTGPTTVAAGTLELDGSLTSTITVNATGVLSGIGSTTGDVTNQGVVAPDPPAVTGTLLVGGNYAGDGGSLLIKAVLNAGGPGNQVTDRLLVEGAATGSTPLNVVALPGSTPQLTGNTSTSGISVVQVAGPAGTNAFQLPHGFIASGPYEMRLYEFPAGTSAPSEIDPRLAAAGVVSVSDYRLQVPIVQASSAPSIPGGLPVGDGPNGEAPGDPVVLPQVLAYRALPPAMFSYGYALADDLHKRLGDFEQGAIGPNAIETFARYGHWSGSLVSDRLPDIDQNLWYLQVGAGWVGRSLWSDGDQLHLDATGALGSAHLNANIDHDRVDFDAQSLGGTATYMAARGWYLDAVLQDTDYRRIRTRTVQEGEVDEFGGHGWLFSLEGGYPFWISGTSIEPRASIAYQHIDVDHAVDLDRVSLQLGGDASLLGRIGLRAEHPFAYETDGYHFVTPFLTLDYLHDFKSGKQEQLDTISFETSSAGSALRFGGGVTAQLGSSWGIYLTIERSVAQNHRGFAGTGGEAGMRVVF